MRGLLGRLVLSHLFVAVVGAAATFLLVRLLAPQMFDQEMQAMGGGMGRGLGLREQLIWPEIDYDKIDRVRGMEITLVTTAKTDDEGRRLLQLFGMPFRAR
jgi:large subunit ribosomal protein L5